MSSATRLAMRCSAKWGSAWARLPNNTARLRGLVRMGARRWDVVLDRGQRILLPAEKPVAALERLLAMDQAEKILDRDVSSIDLRDERRPVLRLAPFALSEVRRASGIKEPAENSL